MPPAPKRNFCVILFDENCDYKFESVQALLKIALAKHFSSSKDEARLFLTNCKNTENDYGYENIFFVEDVCSYEPKLILENIDELLGVKGNWLEGLMAGVKHLCRQMPQKGVITWQLLYITDLTTQINPSVNDNEVSALIKKISKAVNDNNIYVYLLGPQMVPDVTLASRSDLEKWTKTLQVPPGDRNLNIAKEIIEKTEHTIMCDFRRGLHLFMGYQNPRGSQPWLVPLTIGSEFEISATTSRHLKQEPLTRLKSGAKRSGIVKWVHAEDQSIEVDFTDVVRGVSRHQTFVNISRDMQFKIMGPRSFNVLGFTASKNVPEYFMRGEGTYVVKPQGEKSRASSKVMSTLIENLSNQKKYVIARRVYNANFNPKYVALIPQVNETSKCFLLVQLPYADDIKFEYIEKSLNLAPKEKVEREICDFLDHIDVNGDKCKIRVPLGPTMMLDTDSCRIINKGGDLYTERELNFQNLDTNLSEKETITEEIFEPLKSAWPARELPKKSVSVDKNDSDSDGF